MFGPSFVTLAFFDFWAEGDPEDSFLKYLVSMYLRYQFPPNVLIVIEKEEKSLQKKDPVLIHF